MVTAAPLLATKFYPPVVRTRHVVRTTLFDALDAGVRSPLTLISAPAGFGKSTLVAAWAAQVRSPGLEAGSEPSAQATSPNRVAWLSLDEADNDPTRFWTYLVGALQRVIDSVGDVVLGLLQAPQPPPLESLLAMLINELAALPTVLVLVLDDYHQIETPAIHQTLADFIDHLPAQLRFVIATRADPPLPLARWRVRGQLHEIRANALRFSPAEAELFLRNALGTPLAASNIEALTARTEGWVAGLQLAAISLQGLADPERFIASFTGSHRYVMDYLAEEVLQRQPADVQQFLARTSILDRLCADLCDTLAGATAVDLSLQPTLDGPASPSHAMLERLLRANLFLIPLDDEQRWYRYHHLFADMLRRRLAPHVARELHGRAGDWFDAHGFVDEAIHHAIRAEAWACAAARIEKAALATVQQGQVLTVQAWLERLPEPLRVARPGLALAAAYVALGMGQPARVETSLDEAASLAQTNGAPRSLLGEIAAARALLATFHQQHPRAIAYAQSALADLPPERLNLRAAVAAGLGFAYFTAGQLASAQQVIVSALDDLPPDGPALVIPRTALLSTLGMMRAAQGRLNEAIQLQRQALAVVDRAGRRLPLASTVMATHELGRLLLEQNQLDEAEATLQDALAASEPFGNRSQAAFVVRLLAQLAQARGDYDRAAHLLDESETMFLEYPVPYIQAAIEPLRAQLWLRQGNLAAAAEWAAAQSLAELDQRPIHPYDWTRFALAEVWIASGEFLRAVELMQALRERAHTVGLGFFVRWSLAIEALARYRAGAREDALALNKQALALAAPEQAIRLFADLGPPMYQLLFEQRARLANDALLPFVDAMLADAGHGAAVRSAPAEAAPSALVEPLSNRELEVLRLMAGGLTNQAIAERLVVTIGAIKKHLNNIYGKLGVHSRTQATVRARELGML